MTEISLANLISKRMALVEKLSALNAKQLKNTTERSGIEVELESCIEDIERDGETAMNRAQRTELETRMTKAITACTDCEQELDKLAAELNALDQQAGPVP